MNSKILATQYAQLTPEERFRLAIAASGRGDAIERDRLMRSSERIHFAMPDVAPYLRAFNEIAVLIYIELLEEAAYFMECFDHASEVCNVFGDERRRRGP